VPDMHITIDTQLILIGNGMSDITRTPSHQQLMAHFHQTVFLALDFDGQIRAEYERKRVQNPRAANGWRIWQSTIVSACTAWPRCPRS
jgi:phage portal protein BeeE